ncbi:hypothetical protein I7I48_04097 [Histoplasma ohiense]|nr:hypothetical protein I7I48_04097 [Histoplasma ohiense (nom. inval.)]
MLSLCEKLGVHAYRNESCCCNVSFMLIITLFHFLYLTFEKIAYNPPSSNWMPDGCLGSQNMTFEMISFILPLPSHMCQGNKAKVGKGIRSLQ